MIDHRSHLQQEMGFDTYVGSHTCCSSTSENLLHSIDQGKKKEKQKKPNKATSTHGAPHSPIGLECQGGRNTE